MTPRTLYTGRLLRAVDHADRFCAFLASLEGHSFDLCRRAWLMGRRQEIGRFIERIGLEYRKRNMDESAALGSIEAYLDGLHASARDLFGERLPSCCRANAALTLIAPRPTDSTPTTLYVRPEAVTRPIARPIPRRQPPPRTPSSVQDDAATWLDVEPDQILAGLHPRPE